jgi:hypothetical protein
MQADTEAWHGRMPRAREYFEQAMDSAKRFNASEYVAGLQIWRALMEAEMAETKPARADATAALKLALNRATRQVGGLALARAGDVAGAETLCSELDKRFPLSTLVQRRWLPLIRAAVAISRRDPNSGLEHLQTASAMENGADCWYYPAYLRGEAYLMLRNGPSAAVEYRKLIEHPGIVWNTATGSLARLGLARALALEGSRNEALAAYEDFLTLWKDADPDVPILKRAQAEYTRLRLSGGTAAR